MRCLVGLAAALIFRSGETNVAESVKALAVTTQISRYRNSSFRLLAGQFWLGKLGWANLAVRMFIRVFQSILVYLRVFW